MFSHLGSLCEAQKDCFNVLNFKMQKGSIEGRFLTTGPPEKSIDLVLAT